MHRDSRLRTAALLLAVRAGRALLLLALVFTALFAAVTSQPIADLFPGPWLGYLAEIATLDFGAVQQIYREQWVDIATWNVYIPDRTVTTIIVNRLPSTLFLLLWTTTLSVGGGFLVGLLGDATTDTPEPTTGSLATMAIRVVSVYVLAELLVSLLNFSDRLFNFDWQTVLVDSTPIIFGLRAFPNIATVEGVLLASKWAIVPAIAASTAVAPTVTRITRAARATGRTSAAADTRYHLGGDELDSSQRRHTLTVWLIESLPTVLAVLPVAVLVAEVAVRNDAGLSRVAGAALLAGEPGLLAALTLLVVGPALLADVLREPAIYLLTGTRRSDPTAQDRFALPAPTHILPRIADGAQRLRPLFPRHDASRFARLRANPGPALAWVGAGLLLLALQAGAILDVIAGITGAATVPRVPTLVSWTTIPDGAYPTPAGTAGSFLGLPQWAAWTIRLLVAETYLALLVGWAWLGVRIARVIYADNDAPVVGGPLAAAVRTSRRIAAGAAAALLVIAIGVFAPATAPAMADNPTAEFSDQTVTFYDPSREEIRTESRIVVAGTQRPTGVDNGTAGPLEYGRFGRFHPIGILLETTPAATGGQTRDAFLPFAMRLQQLIFTVGLVVAVTGVLVVLAVPLAATHRWLDAALSSLAAPLALVAFPLGVATVRRTVGDAGFTRVGDHPSLPPSPVDQATSWLDQSVVATRNLALALLLAAAVLIVARRYLHPDDRPGPERPRTALQRVALPALTTLHFVAAGAIVVILVERLFIAIDPGAVLFFDVGVSMDFTWIDTALWYRNTLPVGIQLLLAAALALVGDGLRGFVGDRPDPTSYGTTESGSGGEGA